MEPPNALLDSLKESIASGIFIDTKFYVFSRREPSGRVGSPRPLYCNSHVLNTVPYLSACELQKPTRPCVSDDVAPKCSRTDSRKDKYGTSMMDSPLTPSLTPSPTTTCPTATSKTMSLRALMVIVIQTQNLRLRPRRTHNQNRKLRARLKPTTCKF